MMKLKNTKICQSTTQAAEMLRLGALVAFPTETVYGLGADAQNPESVAGIFESKGRPSFDPLIVHVCDTSMARAQVTWFPDIAERLAKAFWPGPLTMVLPKQKHIPDLVTAGLPGVGVRIPAHPIAQEILSLAQIPVAAPSANPFGGISPTTAQHVLDGLRGQIDAVMDGGACEVGVESTVISLMTDSPVLLRPGGVTKEQIEREIGPISVAAVDPDQDDLAQPSPGMLSRHYAPQTTLMIVDRLEDPIPIAGKRTGLLTYGDRQVSAGFSHVEYLSYDTNLRTCAAKLFAALRSLDSQNLDVIIARNFPNSGLGVALNDRLSRAASM